MVGVWGLLRVGPGGLLLLLLLMPLPLLVNAGLISRLLELVLWVKFTVATSMLGFLWGLGSIP